MDCDAYGQEILAYLNDENSFEIVEREDGYIDISQGAPTYFATYGEWPLHQQEAMEYVQKKALDIGCGAGRVPLYLQERGVKVTAIDISSLAIDVCRKRGVKDARIIPIEDIDTLEENFDTIIMLGNNFGLFGNRKKAKNLLRIIHNMTTDSARIIAESNDPHKTRNPAHIDYQEENSKKGRMPGQLRVRVRFKQYTGKWFDYLLVSKDEMEDILEGTGWEVYRFIDSETSSYVAIIEKVK